MQGNNEALRSTRDLALAAWLHLNGLRIHRAVRKHKHDWEFTFADPDSRWTQLAIEFTNSESRRFDDAMRAIKKLAGINGGGKRR